jgi:hypothetical protein
MLTDAPRTLCTQAVESIKLTKYCDAYMTSECYENENCMY